MNIKKILCVFFAVVFLFACACGKSPDDTNSITSSGSTDTILEKAFSLLYCSSDPLNPYTAASLVNRQLSSLIFDPLVRMTPEFQPEYILAKNIEPNGKTAVITLKTVFFSDGSQLTADDVVYSFNLAKESTLNYSASLSIVTSMKADGTDKITVTLSKADPYFANLLDFPVIKSNSDKLTDQNKIPLPPIGSGRYVPDLGNAVLTANVSHIGGEPTIKTINLINAPDNEVIKYNLETGSVSIYGSDLSDGIIPAMIGTTSAVSLNNLVYLGVNLNNSVLKNEKMRYAISEAIDRTAICTESYHNYATPATGLFNPVWEDAKGLQNISAVTNSQNIVAYFDELGYNSKNADGYYVDSKDRVLTLSLVSYSGNQRRLAAARLIKQQLEAVGIKISLHELDWDAYLSALSSKSFDLYIAEVMLQNNMDVSNLVTAGGSLAYGIPMPAQILPEGTPNTTDTTDTTGAPGKDNVTTPPATEETTGNSSETDTAEEYTVGNAVSGFYNEQLSLIDIINAFNADMPLVPICYRSGVTVSDITLKSNRISSANDVYFGISNISR